MEKSTTCPSCNASVPAGFAHCGACGHALPKDKPKPAKTIFGVVPPNLAELRAAAKKARDASGPGGAPSPTGHATSSPSSSTPETPVQQVQTAPTAAPGSPTIIQEGPPRGEGAPVPPTSRSEYFSHCTTDCPCGTGAESRSGSKRFSCSPARHGASFAARASFCPSLRGSIHSPANSCAPTAERSRGDGGWGCEDGTRWVVRHYSFVGEKNSSISARHVVWDPSFHPSRRKATKTGSLLRRNCFGWFGVHPPRYFTAAMVMEWWFVSTHVVATDRGECVPCGSDSAAAHSRNFTSFGI